MSSSLSSSLPYPCYPHYPPHLLSSATRSAQLKCTICRVRSPFCSSAGEVLQGHSLYCMLPARSLGSGVLPLTPWSVCVVGEMRGIPAYLLLTISQGQSSHSSLGLSFPRVAVPLLAGVARSCWRKELLGDADGDELDYIAHVLAMSRFNEYVLAYLPLSRTRKNKPLKKPGMN